jgi:hypothetical protein
MNVVVVYESMYGNTHVIAEAIGAGMGEGTDVLVTPVEDADASTIAAADLVVVGGPTHVHGMASNATRRSAIEAAGKNDDIQLDPDAAGPGLRDWFDFLPWSDGQPAAAFDTRLDALPVLTGRASKGITRRLRKHRFEIVGDPASFLVDKENHLIDGQTDLAREWGTSLAAALRERQPSATST